MTGVLDTAFGAAWLLEQEFPPIEYVVEGIVPEGFTILAAAPKVGKSWLVLGLGLAVSSGHPALGAIPTEHPRPVLYAALEDGQRRLHSRLRALNVSDVSDRLQFITQAPKEGILAACKAFAELHADQAPVMIVDTLGKVAPPARDGETAYDRDYRVGSGLKAISDSVPGASVLAVHHSRKAHADDFLDAVSGTQGLAGSADTVLVLKRDRLERTATLSVTSRDAAEGEYSLRIEDEGTWILDGTGLFDAAAHARDRKVMAGVGEHMAEILAVVAQHPEGIAPKDVKTLLPQVPPNTVDQYLHRAHESNRLAKIARGRYAPVSSVMTVSSPIASSDASYTHDRGDIA